MRVSVGQRTAKLQAVKYGDLKKWVLPCQSDAISIVLMLYLGVCIFLATTVLSMGSQQGERACIRGPKISA